MIEVNIPKQNELIKKIMEPVFKKGLIIISSSDQNWNFYILMLIVNALMENMGTEERKRRVVSLGEEDQYSTEWNRSVNINEIMPDNIVLAGDLRSLEKIKDAFELAEKCIVIGVVHADNMESAFIRFSENLGITDNDLKDKIKIFVKQE